MASARLSIARAFYANPKLLLLDEATAALDNESEARVQQALEGLMKDRTTVVVAHRLSTIKNADQIAYVEEGRVVELGTHAQLIEKGGKYAALVNLGDLNANNGPPPYKTRTPRHRREEPRRRQCFIHQNLGVPPYKEEAVENEGVRTSFFKAGPNKIELLEATNPKVPSRNSLKSAARAYIMWPMQWRISKPKWRVSKAKGSLCSTKSPRPVQITNGCVSCTPKARAVR